MAICFDAQTKIFKLDTNSTSYVMQIGEYGYLKHLYYGALIPDVDLSYLGYTCSHSTHHPCVEECLPSYFSKDVTRMEYSCNGCGDFRGSALSILRQSGTNDTDIQYHSHRIYAGKPKLSGQPATYAEAGEADTLELVCLDSVSGAEVTLFYTVFRNHGAMTRHVVVKNTSDGDIELERVLSLCMDFHDARGMDFIHLYGDWSRERSFERLPMSHGAHMISSKRGCSSHAHNPFVALCSKDATERAGDAYGFNLVYTGNFLATAEMDYDGGARVLMGINPENFQWHLSKGESFCAPEVVMVYSSEGLGGMSRIFHGLYREHLCRGPWKNQKRPILVNTWEAAYFNFDDEKICELAQAAADLGIELLVMDDGWFGKNRNSDKASIGDWFVNEAKIKCGIKELARRVNAMGVKFGIWFEPETVSVDSELYRAHPEWVVQSPNRQKSVGRHTYVLDMGREDVRDYLFDCIRSILDEADIAYVKWDFNRSITEVASATVDATRQKEAAHRYVLGLYELLERIHTRYPNLLLEGCASGGGRFDPAWLYYAPQIWASDNTDALERLDIQYGTSMCYPASSMGAHVSSSPNHQLNRRSPFKTRGDVALAGVFGYELDITRLNADEQEAIRQQCASYHKYYDVVHNGDLYRLVSPWESRSRCAWSYVSKDKREALITYVVIRSVVEERYYLKPEGLDPALRYKEAESGLTLSGSTWMNAGICITGFMEDSTSRVFHLVAVED